MTVGAATVVAYKGYEYRTLDGTAPTVTSSGCQDYYLALPAGGWALAPDNADAVAVTAAYHWGAHCLVFASAIRTAFAINGPAGGDCSCSSCFTSNELQYKIRICSRRILISRPCAAGGYHGSTRTTYAEAATATCTPCAAGQYSTASGAAGVGVLCNFPFPNGHP